MFLKQISLLSQFTACSFAPWSSLGTHEPPDESKSKLQKDPSECQLLMSIQSVGLDES